MRMIFFPAVFSTDSVAAAAAEIDSFGERLLGCRDTGETLAGVFAAEGGPWENKEAERGDNGRFSDVFIGDGNLMVAFHKVYF